MTTQKVIRFEGYQAFTKRDLTSQIKAHLPWGQSLRSVISAKETQTDLFTEHTVVCWIALSAKESRKVRAQWASENRLESLYDKASFYRNEA